MKREEVSGISVARKIREIVSVVGRETDGYKKLINIPSTREFFTTREYGGERPLLMGFATELGRTMIVSPSQRILYNSM